MLSSLPGLTMGSPKLPICTQGQCYLSIVGHQVCVTLLVRRLALLLPNAYLGGAATIGKDYSEGFFFLKDQMCVSFRIWSMTISLCKRKNLNKCLLSRKHTSSIPTDCLCFSKIKEPIISAPLTSAVIQIHSVWLI